MQVTGKRAEMGFTCAELRDCAQLAERKGCAVEVVDLHALLPPELKEESEEACVLVIRNGISLLLLDEESRSLFRNETKANRSLVDKKAHMKGKVVNKHARWNLCYADASQQADYENKRGTIIDFKAVPQLANIRSRLGTLLGTKASKLFAELNYYYDTRKCGIGYHGDTERRIVIGIVCVLLNAKIAHRSFFSPNEKAFEWARL